MGLRLMLYDRTDRGRFGLPRLSAAWRAGAALYRGLGRLDGWCGVTSWEEGLDWLIGHRAGEEIAEIQYWGHGNWGRVKVDGVPLDVGALRCGHGLNARLCAVRERLAPGALWWFRTCETFGADAGHDFARRWSDFFGCRAAGHTYVIGVWQSGLHALEPGARPAWSPAEGLAEGTPAAPVKARWSRRREPNTISCLQGRLPDGV